MPIDLSYLFPPFIILVAQFFVTRYNMVYDKIKRVEDKVSKALDILDAKNEKQLSMLKQSDLSQFYVNKEILLKVKKKHYIILFLNKKDIVDACNSLQELYDFLTDDKSNHRKQNIQEMHARIIERITRIM